MTSNSLSANSPACPRNVFPRIVHSQRIGMPESSCPRISTSANCRVIHHMKREHVRILTPAVSTTSFPNRYPVLRRGSWSCKSLRRPGLSSCVKSLCNNAAAAGAVGFCGSAVAIPCVCVCVLCVTIEGLRERTEHLDIFLFFLPITQWCSISDVLFTGGSGCHFKARLDRF